MRQAGRSLPEYEAVRGDGSILDAIADPDRAAEITIQPVRRYGVDAAILFSDIVVPVHAVGFGIDVVPGTGPVCPQPFRSAADLDRLRLLDPESDVPYVLATVRALVNELDVPLIGFAGGPFTLASYLVEGGPSRHHARTKALMHDDPALWDRLVERLADLSLAFLRAQVGAGATAVQVFDSWIGALSAADYRRFARPAVERIFAGVAELGVPRIHFGVGTAHLLADIASCGADVIGLDWRVPLDEGRRLVGGLPVQGNLDPAICLARWPAVEEATRAVLAANGGRPGHVFNLGHGVLPETDPEMLAAVVELVHEEGGAAGDTTS